MNAIIGMTDILRHSDLDPQQLDYIDTISSAAKSLLEIIDSILDYSRIEANKLELSPIDFSPRALVNGVERSIIDRCTQSEITLNSTVAPDVPEFLVGDDIRIRQIITNLLSNAVKFTPRGGQIKFEMSYTNTGQTDGMLKISVSDTGIGIASDKQQQIFESFTQADPSITRQYGGTGLGLSIVKQLVTLMSGRIELHSELGHGSNFICYLPLARPIRNKIAAQAVDCESPNLQGVKVLLAEDNPVNQKLAKLVLERAGCKVTMVDNGGLAVESYQTESFQIILMDIQMPQMDGLTATKLIRQLEQENARPAVPIVAMTAHAMHGDRERFLESGMNDYISKPFDRHKLLEKIRSLVG